MALSWFRPHANRSKLGPNRPSVTREPDQSVAEVVHQLQDLSSALREQAVRLERANERVAETSKGTP